GPVVVGAVLAVAVHPTAGLLSVGMPVIALGSFLDARRRHRKDVRRSGAEHASALERHREATAAAERARAAQGRGAVPTVVDALHRARSGVGLWPDRGCDDIAVGWSDDEARAPVTVPSGGLGIAGPADWAAAVARAVAVQLGARCGPRDRPPPDVEVAGAPEALSDRCSAVLTWAPEGGRLADAADGRREVAVRPFLASAAHADAFEHAVARWSDPEECGEPPDEVRLGDLELAGAEDGRRALAAPLGVDADGPVVVDLVADGPHALVAGTTGAGKSELLRTWVVALAARHPPTAVAFVLVDYKGGSAFDAVRRLPHVAGLVTDLDPGLGERLLVALRAEVRDREAQLRAAGVADLKDLVGGPPRLVLVVDEFATLAAELPDVLGSLVDVARRGRSLGLHLVLATQRPAGAVNDDIRANTSLRLCLRTLDAADSQDVLGTPDPAGIPPDRPGRAWLRRGGAPQLLQVASGARPAGDGRAALEVRHVDRPWRDVDGPTELDVLVAAQPDRPVVAPIWLPPLPEHLVVGPDQRPGTVVLGRVDRPAERSQPPLVWRPADGHLVVLGGRRSGRTTALADAVLGLAHHHGPARLHVHVVGQELAALAGLPHVGAVLAHHDRDQVRRLVGRLTATGPTAELTLLVVDGFDALAALLDDLDGVRLLEAIDRLVRSDVRLAVTSARPVRLPPSLLGSSATTVVLRLDDVADLAVLGLRAGRRDAPPGRGQTLDGHEVQLAAPPEPDLASAVAQLAGGAPDEPGPAPLGALPTRVRLRDLEPADGLVTVGVRDCDLLTAHARLTGGVPFVIAGPPRSGRTTALRLVADQAPACTVVVDDAEQVEDADGRLRELVTRRDPDHLVLVAVRTDAWRSAYGSWLADLRPAASGLALAPDPARDVDLWAAPLLSTGPDAVPGRGLLVHDGRAALVQVAEGA
ncbi:MAG TPA: FtsK/SpoIIIE domain-containing protein, partial [Acidimicrobiales bacterium]|nr:FtsK/SpoIIIE domain-containing protein [Acidimicrobiales bacterium]